MNENENDKPTRSEFDHIQATLHDRPDVTHTAPSTIRSVNFIGWSRTFVVTTYRIREKGDTVLIETLGTDGQMRLALPPDVVNAIVRQRDALTKKVRRKIGRAQADERKRQGIAPAFLKKGAKAK